MGFDRCTVSLPFRRSFFLTWESDPIMGFYRFKMFLSLVLLLGLAVGFRIVCWPVKFGRFLPRY